MTQVAGGRRRRIPRAWILPLLAMVLIFAAIYFQFLSRSITVDFLAWWPVWALLLVLAILTRGRRVGRFRLSGLIPILALLTLVLFVTGHLRGWEGMPSASNRLIGPGAGAASTGALSAQVDGVIEVRSSRSGFLYAVEPVRWGGEVGLPTAVEQVQGTSISVALEPAEQPGVYTFAGWIIDLDERPTWNLSLGGEVEADLSSLRLSALQLSGEGEVTLGGVPSNVVVNVSGGFEISLPAGASARIVGEADVPEAWIEGEDGFESPTPGDGWVISVGEGSSLRVRGY